MKAREIKENKIEELHQMEEDTERQIFEIKAKKGFGDSSEQPLKIRSLRRNLAKIKTVIRERELKKNG